MKKMIIKKKQNRVYDTIFFVQKKREISMGCVFYEIKIRELGTRPI
jgi:hypothetical protein